MKPFKLFALTFALVLAVSACSLPENMLVETALPSPTVVESTPQPVETATLPSDTATGLPTGTSVSITAAATSSGPVACINSAEFVADITIPDGIAMESDSNFVKTWRVKNTGTCTWSRDYSLVFTDGTLMMPVDRLPLPGNTAPGQTVDLSLDMKAPIYPGAYESDWKLRAPNGSVFGVGKKDAPLWVKLVIGSIQSSIITGYTYQDTNGNSQVDSTDVLMANREVWLQKGGCDLGGERVATAFSGSDGRYTLSGPFSGTYCVGLKGQDGMEDVATLTVTLGQTLTNWNLRATIPNAVISGMVWKDMQTDGIWQSIEPKIPGLTVLLQLGPCSNPVSQVPVSANTDVNGLFSFNSLYGGTYCVSIRASDGGNASILGSGSWTMPVNGNQQITIRPGEQKSANFGWANK